MFEDTTRSKIRHHPRRRADLSFVVTEADADPLARLALPERTRVICLYRGDK